MAGMTVLENATVGAFARIKDVDQAAAVAGQAIASIGLQNKADTLAGSLTLPDRKMLELARAVATCPRLLLLDEVMAGLRPSEGDRIVEIERELRAGRMTVLLIEHIMRVVMALANRVIVLHHGEKLAEGTPAEIGANQTVIESHFGQEGGARMSAQLEVRNLEVSYGQVRVPNGVSFDVPSGALTAVVGANGAGKTSLVRAIAGMIRPSRGISCSTAPTLQAAIQAMRASWASVRWRRGVRFSRRSRSTKISSLAAR